MNDVTELKRFAELHGRAQSIGEIDRVLERIDRDTGDEPGSWPREWLDEAERLHAGDRLLDAVRHYNMARFPFVDGPARTRAREHGVAAFGAWAARNGVERLDVELPGGSVGCWSAGLSARRPRPLVVICGGIVSSKEQWAPALTALRRFGLAGVVTEMPGVGENRLPYQRDSWRMFPAILDAVADRADVTRTYAMTLSFSGHLALRCAVEDSRIRGVVTAGVPVRHFFTDEAWLAALPRVTVDTLAHLTGVPEKALPGLLRDWAIPAERLAALDIPVACTASARDEIVPPADVQALRAEVGRLWLVENDDVHGSPRHVVDTRLWAMRSILRMHGGPRLPAGVLGAVLGARRLRRRFTTGRAR